VPKLLELLGIKARREGSVWRASCPDPEHSDSEPSWSIKDDGSSRHGSHWCFGCGFGGGPWELAAVTLGLSLELDDRGRCEAGEWVWQHVVGAKSRDVGLEDVPRVRIAHGRVSPAEMMLPPGVVIPSLVGCGWHEGARAYLDGRSIPDWQLERWHVGYATRGRCAWRVVVPVHTGGRLLSYVARLFIDDPSAPRYDAARKTDMGARPDAALFGEPGFDPDNDVATVTEGVFKAMAMERAGAPNPCAILGAQNLGPEKIELLARFPIVLSALDPDAAGRKAHDALVQAIGRYSDVRPVPLLAAPDDQDEGANKAAWWVALHAPRRSA
jgi:hypothetical protein